MDCGAHASLYENFHHQIIYAKFSKFSLQIYFPPPYKELCSIIIVQTRIISEKLYAASNGKGPLQIKM